MPAYSLKVNNDKAEFMPISSKHMLKTVEGLSFHLEATEVSCVQHAARNLGVMIDSVMIMSMEAHVTAV